jgi:hypothetical protein
MQQNQGCIVPENNATKIRRIGINIPKVVKIICLEGVMLADAAGAGSEDLRFAMSRLVISAGFIDFFLAKEPIFIILAVFFHAYLVPKHDFYTQKDLS